jgi:hypothetical protein
MRYIASGIRNPTLPDSNLATKTVNLANCGVMPIEGGGLPHSEGEEDKRIDVGLGSRIVF